jgi:nanoRNase/pAp phosphatase (c-di-AMP/oligoRNAs hydrolase)
LILTHENPDPDSLSSAAALRHLLHAKRGIEAVIGYSGIVGRAENRAMVDILDLDIRSVTPGDLARYRHVALIDAQPFTGNSALPPDRVPDIVIDHHPLRPATREAKFYDVRDDYGASATILTNYLREASVHIPSDLATALLYGIQSETRDLTRETSEADRDAYHFLLRNVDGGKLATISKPRLERRYFVQMAAALDAVSIGDGIAICALAEVIDPDFVPEMADFIVRMEEVHWVLVYGYFGERLFLSIRTDDEKANAGELMQKLLHGVGHGGGHGMRAGGNVPLGDVHNRHALERDLEQRFLSLRNYSGVLARLRG